MEQNEIPRRGRKQASRDRKLTALAFVSGESVDEISERLITDGDSTATPERVMEDIRTVTIADLRNKPETMSDEVYKALTLNIRLNVIEKALEKSSGDPEVLARYEIVSDQLETALA